MVSPRNTANATARKLGATAGCRHRPRSRAIAVAASQTNSAAMALPRFTRFSENPACVRPNVSRSKTLRRASPAHSTANRATITTPATINGRYSARAPSRATINAADMSTNPAANRPASFAARRRLPSGSGDQ